MAEPFDVISEAYTVFRAEREARDGGQGELRPRRTFYQRSGEVALTDGLAAGGNALNCSRSLTVSRQQ